jgi:TonB family protein
MNATLLYSLQTILSAGVFILTYRLFVRNSNAYNWNRFYLLATMIISLFLPHIDISGWFTVEKPIIFYGSLIDFNQAVIITPGQQVQNPFNLSELIMTSYWIVAVLLLLRFSWGIMRILELAKNDDYRKSGNLRLYPIQRKTTFSFFNYIFIQPEHWDKPVTDFIIRHERAHVEHLHSLDNILTELILVFGWFNPFYYVYRNDLHLLHECQADQVVINSGCDRSTYHQLLLNEVSGNLTYIIVNQFSYSLIKRRFKMISKNKQSRLAGFRILLAIPAAFALLLLFSFTSLDKTTSLLKTKILQPTIQAVQSSIDEFQNQQQSESKINPSLNQQIDTARQNADRRENEKRGFPGGYLAWKKYLETESKFPSEAAKPGVNSYIEVSFYVSENGKINNVKVGKGIDDASDKEAIRLINSMPKWTPFVRDGKPISSLIHLDLNIKPNPTNANLPAIANFSGYSKGLGYSGSSTEDDKPLLLVEKNPDFKGGYEAMLKFLSDNIHYPEAAKTAGIQGTVFVQFVVSKTGAITNVKILRGIGNGCDEEAIRVVKAMPDWNPGENDGKAVPVMFQIPVKFQLVKPISIALVDPSTDKVKPIIDKNGDQALLVVEQNPVFQDGYQGMQTFLKDKIQYPPLAQQSKIQGTVFVQFVVTKTGEISNVRILRGIGGGCDEEAMRVVREMPKWVPGRQNGQAVSVVYQIPVKFQLAANK